MGQEDEVIFREVNDDYRREQIMQLAKKYGGYAIAAAFVVVAVVGGYTYEKRRAAQEAGKGGQELTQALTLEEAGKDAEAEKILSSLAKDGPGAYKALAKLQEANGDVAKGKAPEAAALYHAVSEDGTAPAGLRDFAKIQRAALGVDTQTYDTLSRDLASYRAGTSPWRFSAKEILGLSAMKEGKTDEAEKLFGEIMSDGEAPQGMRQRAEIMLALLFEKPKAQTKASGSGETANDTKTQ